MTSIVRAGGAAGGLHRHPGGRPERARRPGDEAVASGRLLTMVPAGGGGVAAPGPPAARLLPGPRPAAGSVGRPLLRWAAARRPLALPGVAACRGAPGPGAAPAAPAPRGCRGRRRARRGGPDGAAWPVPLAGPRVVDRRGLEHGSGRPDRGDDR